MTNIARNLNYFAFTTYLGVYVSMHQIEVNTNGNKIRSTRD